MTPAPNRTSTVLKAVMVFRYEDAGALQNLARGELLRWDWVCTLPAHWERPRWIPKAAQRHELGLEVAFTWPDGAA